jgi:uncharacterized membrane protein YvbJ
MKICGYCGKENDDTLVFCAGCGTAFSTQDKTNSAFDQKPRVLNARSATLILLAVC